ncbi:hypothetical protein HZF08_00260 [Paenibacillus sp. CGMCC 1.16610]|nr:hypothetical protein [Paenibacillus sp. CGMCC 1.16610]
MEDEAEISYILCNVQEGASPLKAPSFNREKTHLHFIYAKNGAIFFPKEHAKGGKEEVPSLLS